MPTNEVRYTFDRKTYLRLITYFTFRLINFHKASTANSRAIMSTITIDNLSATATMLMDEYIPTEYHEYIPEEYHLPVLATAVLLFLSLVTGGVVAFCSSIAKKKKSAPSPKAVQFKATTTVIETPTAQTTVKEKEEPELVVEQQEELVTSTPPPKSSRPPATPFGSPDPVMSTSAGSVMTPAGRRSARLAKVGSTVDHEGQRRSNRVSSAKKKLRM